jgi:hypothetical protein
LFLAGALLASSAWGTADFATYQTIIDRKPFGDEPKPGAEGPKEIPLEQSFAKELRLTTVIDTPSGPRVGFQNTRTQKNYWMAVGDVEDEIELVDMDYDGEWARVRKGADTQTLRMSPAGTLAAGGAATAGLTPSGAPRLPGLPAVGVTAGGTNVLSYAALRAARKAELDAARAKRLQEAKQTLTGEALQAYLKEYQMNLIRARGEMGPPLPIPLTPEMDSQLVAEGVLPPPETQ